MELVSQLVSSDLVTIWRTDLSIYLDSSITGLLPSSLSSFTQEIMTPAAKSASRFVVHLQTLFLRRMTSACEIPTSLRSELSTPSLLMKDIGTFTERFADVGDCFLLLYCYWFTLTLIVPILEGMSSNQELGSCTHSGSPVWQGLKRGLSQSWAKHSPQS